MSKKQLLHTIEALIERKTKKFRIEEFCFDKQIAFIKDERPFKTAVCSRRAGKTVACAADLIDKAISNPKRVCLYITLSRANAKRIVWGEILDINREYGLDGTPNESELSLKFPNGSFIYLSGASDKTEIEKFRGLPLSICYIDESQSFRSHIRELIDDVISKALFDFNGTLCLIGTPGPIPSGYFYDCAHSKEWSHHNWTMFDNPWLEKKSGKTPQQLLDRDLKRMGVEVSNATIQRECFAKWAADTDALVFKYSKQLNHYDEIPELSKSWEYVIGVDIGFEDADAIAVIGWNPKIKESYLFEEIINKKQGITDLANQIDSLIKKYEPLKVVIDTGGLGKKIAEEIQKRYALPLVAAEKTRKFEYIELLNDALRTKRFYAKVNSKFAQDCMLLEWDKNSEKLKVLDSYHSDICDSVLYAFRESLHWTYEPEKPRPEQFSPEWFKKEEENMEKQLLFEVNSKKDSDIWGDGEWEEH